MSISLSKGDTISLSKVESSLGKVFMGLGWDPVKAKSGGLLGRLFSPGAESIDLDASVILFDAAGGRVDIVYFGQQTSKDGAIRHGGDNLTGDGEGDDEVIHVDLAALPARVAHLVFTVSSFRGQTFNEVDNAVARLVEERGGREICRYALRDQGNHTGVIMASLARSGSGWVMTAHGQPSNGRTAADLGEAARRVLP